MAVQIRPMYRKNIGPMITMTKHSMPMIMVMMKMRKAGMSGLICQGSPRGTLVTRNKPLPMRKRALERVGGMRLRELP